MTRDFSPRQFRAIQKADSPNDVINACPQNFNLISDCFAAIVFTINYTIFVDGGLSHVDVVKHKSDSELRDFAVAAIIELKTGVQLPPRELPYSTASNTAQDTDIRLGFIRGVRTIIVVALFLCYIGIAYQLPGAFGSERANLSTSHLKAMGLRDSARILSWHLSISLAYLPAWIIVSVIWHYRIFTGTNVGLILILHVLLGLLLASWSFFVAVPFGKSPQLAAVAATFLAIVFAIGALSFKKASTGAAIGFSIVFPPGFYVFVIRAIVGYENNLIPTNVLKPDPDNKITILPLLIIAIVDIFLWPILAVLLEWFLYDRHNPSPFASWDKKNIEEHYALQPADMAISISNLGKEFSTSMFGSKNGRVTAISDLSLDIPKYGIYVLLGSNGAGKSTIMSILGGVLGRTRGTVKFEGNIDRPPRGTIGIVPQKNVLFPELTCYQTLEVWRAVKRADASVHGDDDIVQLLRDCDLGHKVHYNASALSGGQKRKLQLAIGLIGGSKIVLVDECTSGVDPWSRRAIWRTLSSIRHERTIIFTTHANAYQKSTEESSSDMLGRIQKFSPSAYSTSTSATRASYHLKIKDTPTVQLVLQMIEDEKMAFNVTSYSVHGTSIEDIFLGLMHDSEPEQQPEVLILAKSQSSTPILPALTFSLSLSLTNGSPLSPLSQAWTIMYKRYLIFRRSWLTSLIAVLVAVLASCMSLTFMARFESSCVQPFVRDPLRGNSPLYFPDSLPGRFFGGLEVLTSPPGIVSTVGITSTAFQDVPDNATLVDTIQKTYLNQSFGGLSVDLPSNSAWFARETSANLLAGPIMLNLASNVLFDKALNDTGRVTSTPRIIAASYARFPGVPTGTFLALDGLGFFFLVMVEYGVVGVLFSYVVSLLVTSPLAAFALAAGYQFIMFVLYLASYLLVFTFAKPNETRTQLNAIHYILSILSPVASVLRAAFVSVNLFSLLCGNDD
ncbi:hypothetical protein EUX98_g195 [Antrodiella citrinella]|uniref:ABC transporter domain-containing protein n=1 Tax=Antrodiella citrinella TaxID=2447956 RepID=A0A4S4N687_9APHY|nr:hypothetical protein EUX98_g195 [Antrodiella citrinella]